MSEEEFEAYGSLLSALESHRELLIPWETMWPTFSSADEYHSERALLYREVWYSPEKIKAAEAYLIEKSSSSTYDFK